MFTKLMTVSYMLLNIALSSPMERYADESSSKSDRAVSPPKIDYGSPTTRNTPSIFGFGIEYGPHKSQYSPPSSPRSSSSSGKEQSKNIFPRGDESFWISRATCGAQVYQAKILIAARDRGCSQLLSENPNPQFRRPTPYVPKNPNKYKVAGPYYLYPISKAMFEVKGYQYFDSDNIVLNEHCQVVGVLSEIPKPSQWLPMAYKFVMRRPRLDHEEQRYHHIDCKIHERTIPGKENL